MSSTSDNMSLSKEYLNEKKDIEAFANLMDGIGHDERVRVIHAMNKKDQKSMWELSKGYRSIALSDLSAGSKPLIQIRHIGKNTLPIFSKFEKRMCIPEKKGEQAQLIGYNFGATQSLVGPGYFVAFYNEKTSEIDVDYRVVPSEKPEDWPEIKDNNSGIGKLVFGNMVDSLRRVSEHITIGSAAKNGKPMGNWFVLCREA
jgi:hypothetical protein